MEAEVGQRDSATIRGGVKERKPAMVGLWMLSLPSEVMHAAFKLMEHGVDQRKLYRLLIKRKPGPKRKLRPAKLRRAPGAPRKHSPELRRNLLCIIRGMQNQKPGLGVRSLTGKDALLIFLREYATDKKKKNPREWAKKNLKTWQNQLSISRRENPENSSDSQ